MHEEFWWQSLQAIEKLLKAGLILNDTSVKTGFGHDIDTLWDTHLKVFGDCAVQSLTKPENLKHQLWSDRPLKDFISKVNRMGHPDSRYGLISHSNHGEDIFKLDQLIFELRRRTIGLDWIVGEDWEDTNLLNLKGRPYRDVIQKIPNHQIREIKFPSGKFETIGSDLEDIHYSWNFSFTRNPEDIERPTPPTMASFGGGGNSYLFLLFKALTETTITPLLREQTNWLLDHVYVGKNEKSEIQEILKTKKPRH